MHRDYLMSLILYRTGITLYAACILTVKSIIQTFSETLSIASDIIPAFSFGRHVLKDIKNKNISIQTKTSSLNNKNQMSELTKMTLKHECHKLQAAQTTSK